MNWTVVGALWGLLGVGLGAFGAHGLKAIATEQGLAWWETAARYQLPTRWRSCWSASSSITGPAAKPPAGRSSWEPSSSAARSTPWPSARPVGSGRSPRRRPRDDARLAAPRPPHAGLGRWPSGARRRCNAGAPSSPLRQKLPCRGRNTWLSHRQGDVRSASVSWPSRCGSRRYRRRRKGSGRRAASTTPACCPPHRSACRTDQSWSPRGAPWSGTTLRAACSSWWRTCP